MKNRSQAGMAIISAVMMAAIVASLSIVMAARAQQWLKQVQNRKNLITAQTIAYAAIDLSRFTIRDDMRNNQLDHLKEPWNLPIPEIKVEDGVASGRLLEMQGRFNLASLVADGQLNTAGVEAFARLCSAVGLSSSLAEKLSSTLKTDLATQRKASENTPVFPYIELNELQAINGFTPAVLAQLDPFLAFLPESKPTNVNFAGVEVLQAVAPGLSASEASAVLAKRSGSYFDSVDKFYNALPDTVKKNVSKDKFTIQSNYFMIDVNTSYDVVHVRYRALLVRKSGTTMPDIVWAKRNYGSV